MADLSNIDERGWSLIRRRAWLIGLVSLVILLSIGSGAGVAWIDVAVQRAVTSDPQSLQRLIELLVWRRM